MASCLVPDFPAVMAVLEHLKELDKQLKEDGVPFASEASLHLTEMTAAITELESDRRAAHELLEVETIENSKIRHKLNNIRDKMTQDIMADVAAARASNAEEIEQLHKDINTVSQLQETTMKRNDALLSQNEGLYPQREQVKAEYEEISEELNDQITVKYSSQMQLDQTLEQIEELKSCIATAEQNKTTLEQNIALEKEAFAVQKENLSTEVKEADEIIKQQKHAIRGMRNELDRINDKKQETLSNIGKLMTDVAKVESSLRKVTLSRCQFEKLLEEETQKHEDLKQQRETLKKELCDLGESFKLTIQQLKNEIVTAEGKIEEGRASGLRCQDLLAQICEKFKHQQRDESEVKAEHFHALKQLDASKLQLEERVASIVKHKKEIKEIDKQIIELREAETTNKRVFERNQEELFGSMDEEKKNINQLQGENIRLRKLLEVVKVKQQEHVEKMTSDISNTKKRYEELRQEEDMLQQRHPKSTDANLLMNHTTQCEREYKHKEMKLVQEIQQSTAETETITASNEKKQKEVQEKEEILEEVEATWNVEQSRNQRLETLTSELTSRRAELQLSIQELKKKTSSLLWPKEKMKAALEQMRASYMDVLDNQASELKAVEMSIYDSRVKLEQVDMENSRLHLRIREMTEDVDRARTITDRYWQEVHQFSQGIKDLSENLQEAWRQDLLVTQDHQAGDGVLLRTMGDVLNHLKKKRQELGNVNLLLHQQMLDFSKRLGDKTITEQQS